MTALSQRAIYAAICWLIAGSIVGACGLASAALRSPFDRAVWVPAHIEAMLLGWMLQVVMAVAWWILPRWPNERNTRRAGTDGRGRLDVATSSVVALNLGVLLAALGHVAASNAVIVGGRLLALAALATFVALVAPRVRAFGDA